MKNLLRKLEKSNFIASMHKQTMVVDTTKYIDSIKENLDKFNYVKIFKKSSDFREFMDLRVKSTIMIAGFFDYMELFKEDDSDDTMISANIEGEFTIVAFKNPLQTRDIIDTMFAKLNSIPIHNVIVNLDYKTKVYILFYDNRFELPGFELN